jgi:hypothetical protein
VRQKRCFSTQIRDGPNGEAPVLAKLCGNNIPASVFSSGRDLWFRYAAPSNIFARGYDISYTRNRFYESPFRPIIFGNILSSNFGHIFISNNFSFQTTPIILSDYV